MMIERKRQPMTVLYGSGKTGRERVAGMALSPEMKVLDIGSGPGILALPMAKRVEAVTVVEPSAVDARLVARAYGRRGE